MERVRAAAGDVPAAVGFGIPPDNVQSSPLADGGGGSAIIRQMDATACKAEGPRRQVG